MTSAWYVKYDIDRYLVYFSFLEMLVLRWLLIGQDTIILLYCCVLGFRLLTLCVKGNPSVISGLLLIGIGAVYIAVDTMLRETFVSAVFLRNMEHLILPAIVILYFGYLMNYRLELLQEIFGRLRVFLNVYLAVNVVIIFLQKDHTYFLMPLSRMGSVSQEYYHDHMSGLLGLDGTHRLALVTVFAMLMNLYHLRSDRLPPLRKLLTCLSTLVLLGGAAYASSINDNNMLYVLILIMGVLFFLVGWHITYNTTVITAAAGTAGLVGLILLLNSSAFGSLRLNRILADIVGLLNGTAQGDERLRYVIYAITACSGLFFGRGFGIIKMRVEPTIIALGHNYRNWGMSDIAPMIATGGLIFYLFTIAIHARILASRPENKNLRKYFALIILILTYYHQVLTHVTMTIPMCWIMAVLTMQNEQCRKKRAVASVAPRLCCRSEG